MATRKSFLLRLAPDLHEEIKAWAEQELRSVNAQIEFLLREAVSHHRKGRVEPPGGRSGDDSARKK